MPLLPMPHPGSRRVLGALALAGAWCALAPPPAPAQTSPPSAEGSPATPRIARVRCVGNCPSPGAASPGAKVRMVGAGLSTSDDASGPGAGPDADPESRPQAGETLARSRLVAPVRGAFGYGQAGARFGAERGGRSHDGQDLIAACGTPVVASRAGVISKNAFHALAGNYVIVDGPAGDQAYMHLQARSPLAVGARVRAGQALGTVGATGNARGCHLHFEMWTEPGYHKGGRAVDPLPFLRGSGG